MRDQIRTAAVTCAAVVALALGAAAQDVDTHDSRPAVRIGQDYTLLPGETTGGTTTILGDATIAGHVEGDVVVVAGSAHLASTAVIDQSVVVVGGSTTIDQGASAGRDLVVIGGTLIAPPGFTTPGEHVIIGNATIGRALGGLAPWLTRGALWGRLIVPDLHWVWLAAGTFFLIYLLLNAIFHAPVRACADAITTRPLSVFLLGLLVLVLSVPVLVILAATVIGLAAVPFALCALIIGGLVGKAGVGRAIGRTVVHEPEPDSRLQSFRSLVIGLAVLTLLYMVPVLGFITWAMTGVFALGAAAVAFRGAIQREHPARVRPARTPPAGSPFVAPPPAATAGDAAGTTAGYAPAATAGDAAPATVADMAGAMPLDREMAGDSSVYAAPPLAAAPPAGDFSLYPRATFLDRVAAFVLDCILVAIIVQLLDLSRHDGGFPLVLLAYHIAFWAWKGTTLGGIVCALRVIRTPGTELRFADALVRGLSSVLSIAALGIGCLWMLQDAERQMWHDKIAGTLVVKVPRHMALP